MKRKTLLEVLLLTLVPSGWALAEARLRATRADEPPALDGRDTDTVWTRAPQLRLEAQGRGGPSEGKKTAVVLKAARDDEALYILLQWQDATEDVAHKPYVWNDGTAAYETGPDREDNAALAFPMRGEFTADMLSGRDELWDVWHWKAQRTGPAGYAMDRTHVFSSANPQGKANPFTARNGAEVWITRPEDAGGSVTKEHSAPAGKQETIPIHYEAVTPSGSAADVRTGQSYGDGWWTVEFARKLNTGHTDDAQFSGDGTYQLGVAVFDRSEHQHHFTAGPITLELLAHAETGERGGAGEKTEVIEAEYREADEHQAAVVWNFDRDAVGKVPEKWSIRQTHEAGAVLAAWEVTADATAPSQPNVLALSKTENYGNMFNLAVAEKTLFKDVDLTVKVKAVSGKEDQGGGPIWRCKDESNYYICRFNPLEGNFRVYFVKDGRRKQLQSAQVETQPEKWYAVRVTMVGDRITCYLDDQKLLEATDDTFKQAGMVGLWTKADASSSFDDVIVSTPASNEQHDARDDEQVLFWEAAPVEQAPIIDGVQDNVWSRAKPVDMVVRKAIGGASPRTVTLRAVYTKDTLYVLAQWKDATPSDMRDPYVWNAAKTAYERPTKPDDQFALEFPISGQFDRNMLSTEREFEADVWHWKAGRGNPNGWVDDKRHIIRHSSFEGAKEYRLGDHATVYIARPNDAGTVPYKTRPAPVSYSGDVVHSFEPQEPTGSCADVRGKGVHDGSMWTLEMARKLSTGQPDDAVLHLDRDNPCAIAVLDDELYWHHSVSPLIHLRFERR